MNSILKISDKLPKSFSLTGLKMDGLGPSKGIPLDWHALQALYTLF